VHNLLIIKIVCFVYIPENYFLCTEKCVFEIRNIFIKITIVVITINIIVGSLKVCNNIF